MSYTKKEQIEKLIKICRELGNGELCESCTRCDMTVRRCYVGGWNKCAGNKYYPNFIDRKEFPDLLENEKM